MVSERFVTEYPQRCMELFSLMEPIACDRQLVGSFSLIVATSVFLIPYERMKMAHPLNQRAPEGQLYDAIGRIERQLFLDAEFWKNYPDVAWRFSRDE